ncbi:hypothetical protein DL767_004983 [Monosporascus sp. MG133]|nr:hypothetical protein DL767_004983 [Monosporascus sp. MG133]
MASTDDVEERENLAKELVEYVKTGRINAADAGDLGRKAQQVAKDQQALTEHVPKTIVKLDGELQALKMALAKLYKNEWIDTDALAEKANSVEQARFDRLLHMFFGRNGSLDGVRNPSPDHKDALLNAEMELLERRLRKTNDLLREEISTLRTKAKNFDTLNAAYKRLSLEKDQLQDRHNILEARQASLNRKLDETKRLKEEAKKAQRESESRSSGLASELKGLKAGHETLKRKYLDLKTSSDKLEKGPRDREPDHRYHVDYGIRTGSRAGVHGRLASGGAR